MIRSFKNAETQSICEGREVRGLPGDIQVIARRTLRMLNAAQNVQDLRVPPGNQREALKGDRQGRYSIGINDLWRICFARKGDGAYEVGIVDYH